MSIKINVEFLFEFSSFERWVNKGASWFKPYNRDKVICLDKNNNCCNIGEDFMAARDNDLFPVKAFRLIRTYEAMLNSEQEDKRSVATKPLKERNDG